MNKLFAIIASGKLEELLPHVTLSNPSGTQEGSGRISWSVESGIHFEGATRGENDKLGEWFMWVGNADDTVADRTLKLEARTTGSSIIRCDHFFEREFGTKSGSEFRLWDVKLHNFTIEDEYEGPPKRVMACFKGVDNIFFHRRVSVR